MRKIYLILLYSKGEETIKRLKDELKTNFSDLGTGLLKLSEENVSQKMMWELRKKNIKRMLMGWDQLKKPDKPDLMVEPINPTNVIVSLTIRDPIPIITKLKGKLTDAIFYTPLLLKFPEKKQRFANARKIRSRQFFALII